MLINNTNINTLGVLNASFAFGSTDVVTYQDWLKGSKSPSLYEQETQYTTLSLECIFSNANRETLENNISNVTALLNTCVIEFDSVGGTFEGYLTSRSVERVNAFISKATFELQGRRLAAEETAATSNAISFTSTSPYVMNFSVSGNCEIPFVISFTTARFSGTLKIKVNGDTFNFADLEADTVYTLDTEKGRFYKGVSNPLNAIDCYASYELPFLKGGNNTVAFYAGTVTALASVTIKYKGRWQ